MNSRRFPWILIVIFIPLVQMACNLGTQPSAPDTFATLNGLYTASALTLQSGSPAPVLTATPSLIPPTLTPIPLPATNTISAPPTISVSRCDAARFVKDITYADGSSVTPKTLFIKTWRIQNIGTCTWTTAYALVFTNGDLMGASPVANLTKSVEPGEKVDVQVAFTAPAAGGNYRGYWKLRNPAGILFGIGDNADVAFWVDVNVRGSSYAAYEFAPNLCNALWANNNSEPPCPGVDGDPQGFAIKLDEPVLENGASAREPALLVSPPSKQRGSISGQYPAFTVQAGDHFQAVVGCEYRAFNCDVIFHLDYKINNHQIGTLGSWHEIYDGQYYPIDLDLSLLAGRRVKFILTVDAKGVSDQNRAIWLNPQIMRQGVPPPALVPTSIFTLTYTAPPVNPSKP